MFYIIFDLCMAVIMLTFGIMFYKSNGGAAKFLSGYNMKADEKRREHDENEMCMAYGKKMMFMSGPFFAGIVIDFRFAGTGCLIAWSLWLVLFILLLVDRHKREQ
ncbi:MAG: DUF3784 domain-containing protein [Lachnospiraceae bacterium]|nr:DUF3784 domain-containing protein [Lachnospiraceae bacterium]